MKFAFPLTSCFLSLLYLFAASADNHESVATVTKDSLTATTCYDSSADAVLLSFTFAGVDTADLPWMAIGYRQDAECVMLPKDGTSGTLLVTLSKDQETGETGLFRALLPAGARSGSEDVVAGIYGSFEPLDNADGFSNTNIEMTDTDVTFSFYRAQNGETPTPIYSMYAIGNSADFAYHAQRGCFELTEFPPCSRGEETPSAEATSEETTMEEGAETEQEGVDVSIDVLINDDVDDESGAFSSVTKYVLMISIAAIPLVLL